MASLEKSIEMKNAARVFPYHYDVENPGQKEKTKNDQQKEVDQEYKGSLKETLAGSRKNERDQHLLSAQKYFSDSLHFLHKYSWIYDFQVTHFLIENQAEKIPPQWLEYLLGLSWKDLNELPFTSSLEDMPPSLAEYTRMCQQLSLCRNMEKESSSYDRHLPEMNPKKSHEILNMAKLVKEISTTADVQLIVDVGAGLGYLSTLIAKEYSLDLLALECKEYLTHGAEERSNKQDAESFEAVTFRVEDSPECFHKLQTLVREKLRKLSTKEDEEQGQSITDENSETCEKSVQMTKCKMNTESEPEQDGEDLQVGKELGDKCSKERRGKIPGACMIGLHCCGSLTPNMLKMFLALEEFQALTCVSCCYHGMEQTESKSWTHFPLSQTLKCLWKKELPTYEMSVYGLRLAAQETRARWRQQTECNHEYHSKNMGYRALLEYVCHKDGLNVQKIKRKIIRKKHVRDLETFAQAIMARTSMDGLSLDLCRRLHEEYETQRQALALVEPFTALQVCMQSVLESLILIDRVIFLRESGVEAWLVPIFDDNISPRNMAILALKS